MNMMYDLIKDGTVRNKFIKKASNLGVELLTAKKKTPDGRLMKLYHITREQFEEIKKQYHLTKTYTDEDFEFVLTCLESKIK